VARESLPSDPPPSRSAVPHPLLAVVIGLLLLPAGCTLYEPEAPLRQAPTETVDVPGAIRAHLADGSVVIFRNGARVGPDRISGSGWRFDLARLDSVRVDGLSMDSVVGLESTPVSKLNVPASVLATVAAIGMAAVGIAALKVALFGSCPTVYASEGYGEVLEAELFSYSIAPLLEGRDVDRLESRAASGVVRLDVRNEALETHRLNHLQLLELVHRADERALPDNQGLPLAVVGLASPSAARDRDGRDVTEALGASDGVAFRTNAARLEEAVRSDLEDVVELVFPAPAGDGAAGDSLALVLRLRNSLLNTVLFYDLMLAARGAEALTWLGTDLEQIGPAVALGRWWSSRMGLRVEVLRQDSWEVAARVADTGPIAWTELAVPLAGSTVGDSVRLRLRFVADGWRIDRAALAASMRRLETTAHGPARLLDADDAPVPGGVAAIAAPDERYLETRPGDRFVMEFDVGPEPRQGARSFLLSSQGYYTEWIRPAWVRAGYGAAADPPEPGDAMLREALVRWADRRESFEREFFESRIPTR
jgi:hypothetical protein